MNVATGMFSITISFRSFKILQIARYIFEMQQQKSNKIRFSLNKIKTKIFVI